MSAPDHALSDIDARPASRSLRQAATAARLRQRAVHTRLALAALAGPGILVAASVVWEPASRAAVLYAVAFYVAWILRLGRLEHAPATEAARWREALDCEAFDLPWNRSVAGAALAAPDAAAATPPQGDPPAEARPFPSQADAVPLPSGRLLCQLAALDWDAGAARRYRTILTTIVGAVAVLLLAAARWRHPGEETIPVTAFALSPAGWWLFHVSRAHQRAGALATRITERVESAWRSGLAGTIQPAAMTGLARGIQNDLFAYRAARPALLPWLARRCWPPVPPGERRLNALLAEYRKVHSQGS